MQGAAFDTQFTVTYALDDGRNPPAPDFRTRPEEPLLDAVARLLREGLKAAEPPRPPIRGRETNPTIVRRYVETWYRHRIEGRSKRSLAVPTASGDEGRAQVDYAIRRAEGLLGLPTYVWANDADGRNPGK